MAINFLNTVAVDDSVLFVDTVNDRVGIGTASPDAKLDVRSTSRTAPVVLKLGNGIISGDNGIIVSQIRSYINNSNNTADELARIQVENSSASHDDGNLSFWTRDGFNNVDAAKQLQINGKGVVELKKSGTAALPVLVLGEDVDTGFFRPSSNNIALSTAGSERVRVTSGGNVGIGVTAPQKKLSVYGDTLIESSGLTASLWFRPSATYNAGGIQTMKVTGSSNPYHTTTSFSNYNAANVLNIVNDKVGIGTTSPGYPLEVNGEIAASGDGYLINGYGWATEGSGVLTLGDWDGSDFVTRIMDENSNEVLRVAGGNVGIGTTTPDYKLDVEGDISLVGGGENYAIMSPINQGMQIAVGDPADTGTPLVTFHGDQKVGIGTTTPASALQVDGGVQIADDTDAASADKVGTLKYRVSGNNSYVDMCMQTGATTYAWINIVQNNW
jgi:hypothetical protein